MATTAKTESTTEIGAALGAPGLVFCGIQIGWRRRPSDLRANTSLAERWESAFSEWSFESRHVLLSAVGGDHRVQLGDGFARFDAQTGEGYQRVLELIPQLFESLKEGKREHIRAITELQYLRTAAHEFDALVQRMTSRTLNAEFLGAIGADVVDYSYLVDTRIKGSWYQINFGAVRDYEIPMRVSATNIVERPSVALFLHVTSKWRVSFADPAQLASRISSLVDVGNSVAQEVMV